MGKSKRGLSKGRLKVLVHNCPRLPTIVTDCHHFVTKSSPKKGAQNGHKVHNCQEPLNAPFLNGLFSSGFSRRKTAF